MYLGKVDLFYKQAVQNTLKTIKTSSCWVNGSKYLNIYFLDIMEMRRILLLMVFEKVVGQRKGHLFHLYHLECGLCFCLIWSASPSLRNNKIAILIFTSRTLRSAKVDWCLVSSTSEICDRAELLLRGKLFDN